MIKVYIDTTTMECGLTVMVTDGPYILSSHDFNCPTKEALDNLVATLSDLMSATGSTVEVYNG